ncbi:hypothetical protein V8E36_009144 [Tilletia maclaganii]
MEERYPEEGVPERWVRVKRKVLVASRAYASSRRVKEPRLSRGLVTHAADEAPPSTLFITTAAPSAPRAIAAITTRAGARHSDSLSSASTWTGAHPLADPWAVGHIVSRTPLTCVSAAQDRAQAMRLLLSTAMPGQTRRKSRQGPLLLPAQQTPSLHAQAQSRVSSAPSAQASPDRLSDKRCLSETAMFATALSSLHKKLVPFLVLAASWPAKAR